MRTFTRPNRQRKCPFVVADTTTDSPGTNLVTRIVTFKAEIGGTPPIALQWKVDKGSGFIAVSARATNSVLVVSNALISRYREICFVCDEQRPGGTNTPPVPLVVVEWSGLIHCQWSVVSGPLAVESLDMSESAGVGKPQV